MKRVKEREHRERKKNIEREGEKKESNEPRRGNECIVNVVHGTGSDCKGDPFLDFVFVPNVRTWNGCQGLSSLDSSQPLWLYSKKVVKK